MSTENRKTTSEMQLVEIAKLIPYVNNARTHSPEQIKKLRSSLREFGFINPVIIDRDYGVIAGHGRIMAAREEGITEVPCVFVDHLTEAQKKAYILADNRMALDAGWDEELLRVELEALEAYDFDMSLTGFDEKELADYFGSNQGAQDDDFDVEAALAIPTFVKRGDIWLLGAHRVMCGDGTTEDVAVLMNGQKADLVITDPPYGVSYGERNHREDAKRNRGSGSKTILNDDLRGDELRDFLTKAFAQMSAHLKAGGSMYVWFATREHVSFELALRACGFTVRQELIWKKNTFTLGRQDYQWDFEPCFYLWKDGASHAWYGDRKQRCVLEFDKPKKNDLHPTQKSVELIAYQTAMSSKADDIVLDVFGGSGTTLVAADQLGRACYTMELDEGYASAIVYRYGLIKKSLENVRVIRDGQEYSGIEVIRAECGGRANEVFAAISAV